MRILVTGHLGFLGQVLTGQLETEGIEWEGLDIGLYQSGPLDMRQDVRRVRIQGFDAIVHLAAIVGEPACLYKPDLARSINVEGSKNIIDEAVKEQIPIIFASTCSVYGAADHVLFEDSNLNPLGFYARQRLEAERYCLENDGVALRFGTLYGWSPRMRIDLVINKWAELVAKGLAIEIEGGNQWRPFCHVEDAARAVILLAKESQRSVKIQGMVYNCASVNVTIKELANQFRQAVGCGVVQNEKIEDMRNYRVNSDRLRGLGWEPNSDLKDRIAELVRHIKNRPYQDDPVLLSNVETLKRRFT